jgi:hypothetical protein
MTVPRALTLGTLAVGTLDLLDAVVFFGLRGAAPHRILQGIAGMPSALAARAAAVPLRAQAAA